MPQPQKDESQEEYVSRCMGDSEMNSKHPNTDERAAVCYSMYRQHKAKAWIDESLNGPTGSS